MLHCNGIRCSRCLQRLMVWMILARCGLTSWQLCWTFLFDLLFFRLYAYWYSSFGCGNQQDLFIIGASNRPDLIDPALLRPGRFDKLLYVGVNSEVSYRERYTHIYSLCSICIDFKGIQPLAFGRILEARTRKFKLHENVSLYKIAQKCPPNFTGADIYALCADAWFHAAKRKVNILVQLLGFQAQPSVWRPLLYSFSPNILDCHLFVGITLWSRVGYKW